MIYKHPYYKSSKMLLFTYPWRIKEMFFRHYLHQWWIDFYLIPCPGPQLTLSMETWWDPCNMAIQSSPVSMVFLATSTSIDWLIWIPSVLGLSSGALRFSRRSLMLAQLVTNMWKPLGFVDVTFCIIPFLILWKYILCTSKYTKLT